MSYFWWSFYTYNRPHMSTHGWDDDDHGITPDYHGITPGFYIQKPPPPAAADLLKDVIRDHAGIQRGLAELDKQRRSLIERRDTMEKEIKRLYAAAEKEHQEFMKSASSIISSSMTPATSASSQNQPPTPKATTPVCYEAQDTMA